MVCSSSLSASRPRSPVSSFPLPHMPQPGTAPGAEDPILPRTQKEALTALAAAKPLPPGSHTPQLEVKRFQEPTDRQTRHKPAPPEMRGQPHALELLFENLDQLGPRVRRFRALLERMQG